MIIDVDDDDNGDGCAALLVPLLMLLLLLASECLSCMVLYSNQPGNDNFSQKFVQFRGRNNRRLTTTYVLTMLLSFQHFVYHFHLP